MHLPAAAGAAPGENCSANAYLLTTVVAQARVLQLWPIYSAQGRWT